MPTFRLDDAFIAIFAGSQPNWGPVGYVTYKRTYARSLSTVYDRHRLLGERYGLTDTEEFWLTLVRVVEGCFRVQEDHCKSLHLPWNEAIAQKKAQEMYRLMWAFKFSPPGRGLWMMGAPVMEKLRGSALNNCAFVSTKDISADFAAPFCFLMDFSMLGVGVGFDVRGAGTMEVEFPAIHGTHVVEDTREGWVDLLRVTLEAFAGRGFLPERVDVSQVRPAGSAIRGFGGTASGPEPLLQMWDAICHLLHDRIGQSISAADITDIANLVGRCVVSGNVRRSAEIALGEDTDDYLDLKDPALHPAAVAGWRWASNNSILAKVGQSYARAARRTAKNGEPGYQWLENARAYSRMGDPPDHRDAQVLGTNPCNEQPLEDRELCNLVETYPAHHETPGEYLRTLKYAYLYAKTVTLLPTHDPRTNAVTMKNRRIGCSMSGIVQAIARHGYHPFFKDFCDRGYEYLRELDREYSDWLCVPQSIKRTTVKPSGTVSLLCGATPGMHYPESEFYWRVIRFAKDSPLLAAIRAAGYKTVDLDPAKEPNTTAVYFPVREANFQRCKHEVGMWEQLILAEDMQKHWSDNQVSVTVTFDRPTEGGQIERALEVFQTRLKGVSFLPRENHGYEHAPYQPISAEEYAEACKGLRPLDLSGGGHEVTDAYCDGDRCQIPPR